MDTVQSDVAAGDETVEEGGEGEKQPAEEGGGEEEKTEAEVPIRRVAVASPPESPAPIRASRRAEVDGGAGAEYKAYDQVCNIKIVKIGIREYVATYGIY